MRRIAYPVLRNGIVTTDGECYATKPNKQSDATA